MDRQTLSPRASVGILATTITVMWSGVGITGSAFAQETETSLEEITVTGSRIRRDDFNSATPTTVIDSNYLDSLGLVNLSEAMIQIPANISTNTPTASPGGNFFNGSTIANLRGLNPFFGSRTLTLVDSRRHVPTNQGDGVDLNFIPSVLIDRMEVVTGGASASYGSGAIGGVTNILLDRDFEGVKAQIDFGSTGESDGDDSHLGFAFGTGIGERGHFVIGIEAQEMDAINNCSSARDWCGQNVGIDDDNFVPGGPIPENVITSGLTEAWRSESGVFWLPGFGGAAPGESVNLQLSADGTALIPYNPGISGDGFFDNNAIGGDGKGVYDQSTLRSNIDREVVYANFDYDISDRLSLFVEGSFGSVETFSTQGSLSSDYFCIQPDNAFIQPEITGATELLDFVTNNNDAFPCTSAANPFIPGAGGVPIRKDWDNQTNTFNETDTDLTRIAFGFSGQFGESTWTWDAYYQYGESERTQLVNDNRHLDRFGFGVDAILDPRANSPTFGQPVCRFDVDGSTPTAVANFTNIQGAAIANTNLAGGCVPINLFGDDTLTPEALAFGWGFLREDTTVEQEIVEFSTSGELADGWGAGAIRAAAGFSFREESIANIAAEELEDYERLDFLIQYGESFSGDVEVTEVFAEIDVPFTQKFGINAAVRESQYDNEAGPGTGAEGLTRSNDITTWKFSGNWDIIDTFSIRFSESRDIRAPNFRELYYRQVFTPGGLFAFVDVSRWGGSDMDPAAWTLAGGLDVVPEEADTTTIGFVVTPKNANFRFAADFYQIELNDAITPASINLVLDQCFNRDPKACSQITGTLVDPNDPLSGFTDIDTIRAEAFNFRSYNVEGLDITADYVHELDNGAALSFRLIASKTFEQLINPSTTDPNLTRDISGTTGQTNGFLADWAAAPDWSANLTATWARGPLALTGQVRYVTEGKNNALWIGPDDPAFSSILLDPDAFDSANLESASNNVVPSYALFNLSGNYDFEIGAGNDLSVFASINNVFDKDPPLLGTGVGGTNPIFFDTIGRTYRVGLRLEF